VLRSPRGRMSWARSCTSVHRRAALRHAAHAVHMLQRAGVPPGGALALSRRASVGVVCVRVHQPTAARHGAQEPELQRAAVPRLVLMLLLELQWAVGPPVVLVLSLVAGGGASVGARALVRALAGGGAALCARAPASAGGGASGGARALARSSVGGGAAAVWRSGGSALRRGAAPQLWTEHPRGHPQNISIRASEGMTRPNLRRIGSGRGRGFSPVVFPTPLVLV